MNILHFSNIVLNAKNAEALKEELKDLPNYQIEYALKVLSLDMDKFTNKVLVKANSKYDKYESVLNIIDKLQPYFTSLKKENYIEDKDEAEGVCEDVINNKEVEDNKESKDIKEVNNKEVEEINNKDIVKDSTPSLTDADQNTLFDTSNTIDSNPPYESLDNLEEKVDNLGDRVDNLECTVGYIKKQYRYIKYPHTVKALAVKMKLEGQSNNDICEATGIKRGSLYYILKQSGILDTKNKVA